MSELISGVRCASCRRPWGTTVAAADRRCPFCGSRRVLHAGADLLDLLRSELVTRPAAWLFGGAR